MTAQNRDGPPTPREQGRALVSPQHQVERAAGEFRRGMPVFIRMDGSGEGVLAVAAETVRQATLAELSSQSPLPGLLILTHSRAATLKIRLYTPETVALALEGRTVEQLRAIVDPASDLDHPLKGPFAAMRDAPPKSSAASVKLAKLAGLLPATIVFAMDELAGETVAASGRLVSVSAADILDFEARSARDLQLVGRARLPLRDAEETELAAFRPADGGPEHYAVLIGPKTGAGLATPGPVLTRLHSECFTGDLLASLKCDCGDQLRGAVRAIGEAGGGVLLYLAQEGRGIGMMNKLRTYRLQDEGFDTLEANERLGFAQDERMYDTAAKMLTLLGYRSVRLMTNNPDKIRALEAAGVKVVERVAHSFPDNAHNRDYLRVKAERGGHLL